jgi:hypothetical protein
VRISRIAVGQFDLVRLREERRLPALFSCEVRLSSQFSAHQHHSGSEAAGHLGKATRQ